MLASGTIHIQHDVTSLLTNSSEDWHSIRIDVKLVCALDINSGLRQARPVPLFTVTGHTTHLGKDLSVRFNQFGGGMP